MKKVSAIVVSVVLALAAAITALLFLNIVGAGNVGVVYSAGGVEEQTLSQGWHWLPPTSSRSFSQTIRQTTTKKNTRTGTSTLQPMAEWSAST